MSLYNRTKQRQSELDREEFDSQGRGLQAMSYKVPVGVLTHASLVSQRMAVKRAGVYEGVH